jgi:hypothetical protein
MVEFSRRSVILATAATAAAGAGVTTAVSGLQGSIEGQADVQAEQALTVTDVSVSGDQDASFTRTSDDNTEFQAAVELNNGDSFRFVATVENSAANALNVQIIVNAPSPIDIEVQRDGNSNLEDGSSDLDPDDNGDTGDAVQTGEGTFVTKISGGNDGATTEEIGIFAEVDDTANPGSFDINAAINPLSTDN